MNKASRSRGEERRKQILEATLRVIAREGIRAVRHRAVAKEAKASLSATTYYFTDLHDLLCAACDYWAQDTQQIGDADMGVHTRQLMNELQGIDLEEPETRQVLTQRLTDIVTNHVVEQVTSLRSDRILELAFRHGAMADEQLREVVNRQYQNTVDGLETFCVLLRSTDPSADAKLLLSVIYQAEQQGLLTPVAQIDAELFRPVFARVMSGLLRT